MEQSWTLSVNFTGKLGESLIMITSPASIIVNKLFSSDEEANNQQFLKTLDIIEIL